jgi:TPR repeat protein
MLEDDDLRTIFDEQNGCPLRPPFGQRSLEGRGIPMNSSFAVHYFKLSADQGHAEAQLHYGICLFNGRDSPANLSVAAHYFKLSADQRYPDDQFRYAVALLNGRGISKDHSHATHYFKLAADQGVAPAHVEYAECLRADVVVHEPRSDEVLTPLGHQSAFS